MPKTKRHTTIPSAIRPLAIVVAALLASAPWDVAWSQDALSDRYQAIRAPSQIQAARIARQRLQSDLNALTRAETRLRGELRATERLRFQDPVSRLPAQERALRGQLDRLEIDRRAAIAELQRLDRDAGLPPEARGLSVGPFDPDAPVTDIAEPALAPVSTEEAVAAARAYVEDLLRANRSRP